MSESSAKLHSDNTEKRKSGGVLVYLLVGGAFLACFCCTGVSIPVGYWFLKPGSPSIVGAWENKDANGKIALVVVIVADGNGHWSDWDGRTDTFEWKHVQANTIELSPRHAKSHRLWSMRLRDEYTYSIDGDTMKWKANYGPDAQERHFTRGAQNAK